MVAGIAVQRLEDAQEVLALVRQQLRERFLARVHVVGQDHLAHGVDAVAFEEHVLGAGEADADRAEGHGLAGLLGIVRVRAHVHAGSLSAPLHQLGEVLVGTALEGLGVALDQGLHHFRRSGLDLAGVHVAGGSVDGEEVALVVGLAVHLEGLGVVVDMQGGGAAHADLAHLARHEGGMGRHAAAGGQDAFGRDHAAQILGRGFDADEQDLFALVGRFHGLFGVEVDLAGGGAGAGGKAGGDDGGSRPGPCDRRSGPAPDPADRRERA